jgi:hypothetical protein
MHIGKSEQLKLAIGQLAVPPAVNPTVKLKGNVLKIAVYGLSDLIQRGRCAYRARLDFFGHCFPPREIFATKVYARGNVKVPSMAQLCPAFSCVPRDKANRSTPSRTNCSSSAYLICSLLAMKRRR